jgi:multidrug efflux system membrane fusion protein
MRPIKVGRTETNLALVESGLKAGEQVVVDGQYKLQPGSRVELTSPRGQPTQQKQNAQSARGKPQPKPSGNPAKL